MLVEAEAKDNIRIEAEQSWPRWAKLVMMASLKSSGRLE